MLSLIVVALLLLGVFLAAFRVYTSRTSTTHQPQSAQEARLVRQKEQLKRNFLKANRRISGNVPGAPGQHSVSRWIRLDLGFPLVELYPLWQQPNAWRLRVRGLVSKEIDVGLQELTQLGATEVFECLTWHCVTGWSAHGLSFTGISLKRLLAYLQPLDDWQCLWQLSADGYTTAVTREEAERDDVFLALGDGTGKMLDEVHGGIRLVFPQLYGWKSAKYLVEIRFLKTFEEGYWEKLGCHHRGRVDEEERFQDHAKGVWKVLVFLTDVYRKCGGHWIWIIAMQKGGRLLGSLSHSLALDTARLKSKNS